MTGNSRVGILSSALLLLAAMLAHSEVALAQQSGHSTVPTSGPAAPGGFLSATAAEDPVVARIERLRRELGELAKLYKKEKAAARAERQRELTTGLEQAQTEVTGLLERLRSQGTAELR